MNSEVLGQAQSEMQARSAKARRKVRRAARKKATLTMRKRPKKLCKTLIPILEGLASDPNLPAELRLWAIGAASRLVAGLAVSSTALNALISRVREFQKTATAPTPIPVPAKPQFTGADLGKPEMKSTISPDDALAMIRGQKKGN